ncbi:MAG: M1 family peptidase, partial [Acidimicrobiales bacterium]
MTETTVREDADPSASHRLPYTVEPRRYALHLTPDLGAATFTGHVRIEVEVRDTVTDVVMNAAELTVHGATLERAGAAPEMLSVHLDEEAERVTLRSPVPITPGPAVIAVSFAGVLNDKLHGFYRSEFTDDDGATHVIATTQFEATDARRAFPCFDEPDRKAVFSVTLDVPPGLGA